MVKKLSFVLQDFHINIQDLQEVNQTKVLRKSRISFLYYLLTDTFLTLI